MQILWLNNRGQVRLFVWFSINKLIQISHNFEPISCHRDRDSLSMYQIPKKKSNFHSNNNIFSPDFSIYILFIFHSKRKILIARCLLIFYCVFKISFFHRHLYWFFFKFFFKLHNQLFQDFCNLLSLVY
jgi:hypothetical protein